MMLTSSFRYPYWAERAAGGSSEMGTRGYRAMSAKAKSKALKK